ncbi:hypothetical protein GOQ27_09875 [Clostridium sp. D2Q-11]|uniref:ASCH domain-containing protein n=1 Tax=Anaeromonas frigoriresistens TaxID=2683708 RepID=A0A942UTC3_9FIRM|nr:hypothetical protein [Anaeromonas frigoriresistens]MBS4538773.1 hypothetical protein [Anaeromonas frigoriresistens]
MKIYEDKSYFGWDGDNGVGEMLIQQIIDGMKTATCSFKILYEEQELEEVFGRKGKIVTVFNNEEEPRCNIRILDIFETTFGNPDMRLVRGEGDGEDIERFQKDHCIAWYNTVKDKDLTDDTIFIVELFELVEVME